MTDDNNNTTAYLYDALDRRVGEDPADCTLHVTTYDVHDNAVTLSDASGSVATCAYDLKDRLIGKAITVGSGVSNDTTFETTAMTACRGS